MIIPRQTAFLPNPLAYPAGFAAGVDMNHPAIAGSPAWVSLACLGGANMVNLASGQPGTIVSGPLAVAMNGGVGPSITKNASSGAYTKFTDQAGANANQYFTAAAIFQISSLSTVSGIICNTTTAATGYRTYVFTTGAASVQVGSGTSLSTPASSVVAGVPYFFLVCNSPSGVFSYLVNLNTGVIVSASSGTALAAPSSTSGTFMVGNDSGSVSRVSLGLARAMFSYQPISKQQARQWCANPWAFWHPQLSGFSKSNIVGLSSNLIALFGLSSTQLKSFSVASAKSALVATSITQAKGLSAVSASTPLTAISGRSNTAVKGVAAISALTAIVGKSITAVRGLAGVSASTPLTAIAGRSITAVKGYATMSGLTSLLSIAAIGAIKVKGTAAIAGSLSLLGKSAITLKSVAGVTGALGLLANATVAAKGKLTNAFGKISLAARSQSAVKGTSTISGVVQLLAISASTAIKVSGTSLIYAIGASLTQVAERTIVLTSRVRSVTLPKRIRNLIARW
jgi:hypothetical protein